MIAVAMTALLLGSWAWVADMGRRSGRYRDLARRYAILENHDGILVDASLRIIKAHETLAAIPALADGREIGRMERVLEAERSQLVLSRRRLEHDTRMREKYARAAGRPWITVPPDPPRPD